MVGPSSQANSPLLVSVTRASPEQPVEPASTAMRAQTASILMPRRAVAKEASATLDCALAMPVSPGRTVGSPTSGLAAAEARQLRKAGVRIVGTASETGASIRMQRPAMVSALHKLTGHVTATFPMAAQTAKLTHLIVMVAANLKTFLNRPALVKRILKALPVRHLLVRIANTQIALHAEGMEWHRMMEPVPNAPAVSLETVASSRTPPPATAKVR